MAEKLGAQLVRKGLIQKWQLEDALRVQQEYGCRLGTNLVELEFLDVDTLAENLSEQRKYPVARPSDFEAAPNALLPLIPEKLADKHLAFPLAQDGRKLKVAFAAPYEPLGLDAIQFATGLRIVPCIAPEMRIFFYLDRRYGIVRPARYIRRPERREPPAQSKNPPPPPSITGGNALFGWLKSGEFLSADPDSTNQRPTEPDFPAVPPATSSPTNRARSAPASSAAVAPKPGSGNGAAKLAFPSEGTPVASTPAAAAIPPPSATPPLAAVRPRAVTPPPAAVPPPAAIPLAAGPAPSTNPSPAAAPTRPQAFTTLNGSNSSWGASFALGESAAAQPTVNGSAAGTASPEGHSSDFRPPQDPLVDAAEPVTENELPTLELDTEESPESSDELVETATPIRRSLEPIAIPENPPLAEEMALAPAWEFVSWQSSQGESAAVENRPMIPLPEESPANHLPLASTLESVRWQPNAPGLQTIAMFWDMCAGCRAAEQVALATLEYCSHRFSRGAYLVSRFGLAVLWRGFNLDETSSVANGLRIDLSEASIIRAAQEGGVAVASPTPQTPIDQWIWQALMPRNGLVAVKLAFNGNADYLCVEIGARSMVDVQQELMEVQQIAVEAQLRLGLTNSPSY